MNIYKIEQSVVTGWDTYSDAVVAAESKDDARLIHPNRWVDEQCQKEGKVWTEIEHWSSDWARQPSDVVVTLLGVADPSVKRGTICASFHAG